MIGTNRQQRHVWKVKLYEITRTGVRSHAIYSFLYISNMNPCLAFFMADLQWGCMCSLKALCLRHTMVALFLFTSGRAITWRTFKWQLPISAYCVIRGTAAVPKLLAHNGCKEIILIVGRQRCREQYGKSRRANEVRYDYISLFTCFQFSINKRYKG